MKTFKALVVILLIAVSAKAQNIQTHYDFGEGRSYLTSTIEMFKPDKWGSTFFFVDMDYNSKKDGVSLSYFEIARTFKLGNLPFELHAEYNGGHFGADGFGASFANHYLGGLSKTWASEDFSKIFTLKTLYKKIHDSDYESFQITGVWSVKLLDGKVLFTGFADFWKEEKTWKDGDTDFVFLTEPQLWYNVSENFAVGTEVEISNNFIADELKFMPTLAAKWTF